jgi:hypothetical protein
MSDGSGRGGWIATSSLRINLADTAGTLAVNRGGTGSTSPSGLLYGDGAGNIVTVANNAANWNTAFGWGNHADENYFDMDTDMLTVNRGGTGTSTLAANGIFYAPAADTFGQILPGTNGQVLKMVGGVPQWGADITVGGETQLWATSSNSLLIHPTTVSQVVVIGAAATSSSGFILEVAGNALFGGSLNAQSLSLVNALAVGSGGTGSTTPSGILYGDGAGNIVSLANNSSDWNLAHSWGDHSSQNYFDMDTDLLDVSLGGTGLANYAPNSILYASAADTIGQIAPGNNGEALVMVGGVPTWSTTTPGSAHGLLSVLHNDAEATSTLLRGDLIVGSASQRWQRVGLGPDGYILRSNGTDPVWSSTVAITALGTITSGVWHGSLLEAAYGGTGWNSTGSSGIAVLEAGVWSASSTLALNRGGTGADTASGARENLGLTDVFDYAVDTEGPVDWIWVGDGSGRGHWVATTTLGLGGGSGKVGVFIGTTTLQTQGNFATSSYTGYAAGNARCAAQFAGSFMCRTHDILVTIEKGVPAIWAGGDNAWIAEGPPGYTSNSNDCNGYTSNSSGRLGAFWEFNASGGGMGWLVNCAETKPVACCGWVEND